MCKSTNHIKLCSCQLSEVIDKNYWTLHRYVGESGETIMGSVIFPYGDDILIYENRQSLIENQLNAMNCFDVAIRLKVKDVLTISVDNGKREEVFTYIFTGNKWETGDYAPFELMSSYKEINSGLIEISIDQNLHNNIN